MTAAAEPRTQFSVMAEDPRNYEACITFLVVQRACGRTGPSLDELLRTVSRGTTDCVRESGWHLTTDDYAILDAACKREESKGPNLPKIRRRRR
jgi:hypothetical protein